MTKAVSPQFHALLDRYSQIRKHWLETVDPADEIAAQQEGRTVTREQYLAHENANRAEQHTLQEVLEFQPIYPGDVDAKIRFILDNKMVDEIAPQHEDVETLLRSLIEEGPEGEACNTAPEAPAKPAEDKAQDGGIGWPINRLGFSDIMEQAIAHEIEVYEDKREFEDVKAEDAAHNAAVAPIYELTERLLNTPIADTTQDMQFALALKAKHWLVCNGDYIDASLSSRVLCRLVDTILEGTTYDDEQVQFMWSHTSNERPAELRKGFPDPDSDGHTVTNIVLAANERTGISLDLLHALTLGLPVPAQRQVLANLGNLPKSTQKAIADLPHINTAA